MSITEQRERVADSRRLAITNIRNVKSLRSETRHTLFTYLGVGMSEWAVLEQERKLHDSGLAASSLAKVDACFAIELYLAAKRRLFEELAG